MAIRLNSLVSVIIPCYNYGWSLPETLDSLIAQTYTNWECIVVDDGSSDNSKEVVQAYASKDARFKYVYQVNKGMSAARNHGARLCKGEYIQFLDADDLLVPTKFSAQVELLESNPELDLVYGDVRYFRHGFSQVLSRSHDMRDTPWMAQAQGKGSSLVNLLVKKNIMVMCAPLLRAKLLDRVGGFAEGLRYMEDWEFWVRCGLANAYFYYSDSPKIWSLVRVHPTSTSQNLLQMLKHEIIVRKNIIPLIATDIEALEMNEQGLQQMFDTVADAARYQILEGDVKDGIKKFYNLAVTKPSKKIYYLKSAFYWLKKRAFSGYNK